MLAVAAVNKHPDEGQKLSVSIRNEGFSRYRLLTVNGGSTEAYNDIGHEGVFLKKSEWTQVSGEEDNVCVVLEPHSVNVLQLL